MQVEMRQVKEKTVLFSAIDKNDNHRGRVMMKEKRRLANSSEEKADATRK
jgi:hypothetical protein